MSDQVSGRYPAQAANWALFGHTNNIAQADVPGLTNVSPGATLVDAAAVVTKEITFVPVQVPEGIEITKIQMFVGATKMEAVTTNWAAIYTGPGVAEVGGAGAKGEMKPQLIAQSANSTVAVAATTTASYELEKKVLITSERAPNGYVYVAIAGESTKVGTFASFEQAVALWKAGSGKKAFPFVANAPIAFKAKPTSLESTAPTEPNEIAMVAVQPLLLLT
jgi:hypothetical protein